MQMFSVVIDYCYFVFLRIPIGQELNAKYNFHSHVFHPCCLGFLPALIAIRLFGFLQAIAFDDSAGQALAEALSLQYAL